MMMLGKENVKQIELVDNIIYWKPTQHTFSYRITNFEFAPNVRVYAPSDLSIPGFRDTNGFATFYLPFCMDIDGVPENATKDDCVNECPFGYAIRADGRILNGVRADEWLAKSIQEKD